MAEVKYRIERSLEVKAPPQQVWDAIADMASWPEWKPFIKGVKFSGTALGLGSEFTMKIAVKGPAVPIKVKVCAWDPPRLMAWTGGLPPLVLSVHSFLLEDRGPETLLVSREEFSGFLVWLMKLFVTEQDLGNLHEQWLQSIKARVESGK
jgi:hypothetical protein